MLRNLPTKWDMEADLVAIGSGLAGLGAAITAHDHGASAVVLERADQLGGVTALSLGECWIPGSDPEAALGIEDSPESGFRYLKRLAMGYNDDLATLNLTVHAREALRWFTSAIGLRMMVIRGCPDSYTATPTMRSKKAACSRSSRSMPRRWANGRRGSASRRWCLTA